MTLEVRAPTEDAERDALSDVLCVCFNAPPDGIATGMQRVGPAHQRVALDGARVVGGLWQIPMGQWFGGRSVPMVGIAAVGIESGARGTGVGDQLMAATVRELHQREVPLSCLYPATVGFYRRAGYELAGSRQRIELPLKGLRVKHDGPGLRPGLATELPAMERCYTAFAAGGSGLLDRGEYCWARARQPKGETARHWVHEEHGALSGYASVVQKDAPDDLGYEVHLTDVVVTTPGSVRALLAFLSGHRSMSPRAVFFGSDRHPLLLGLPEWSPKVALSLHWMLRVTHARSALEARGWPAGVAIELAFELLDELLPEHAGCLRLSVADGRATVEPCARADVRLHVRGLAALYTGFVTPTELVTQGLLEGPADELARLATLFAGPSPWMVDMF